MPSSGLHRHLRGERGSNPSGKTAGGGPGSIRNWPQGERPREKLLSHGSQSMSDAELLALLLRTGSGRQTALDLARELLSHGPTLRDLARRSAAELTRLRGIGPAKSVEILAAFELGRRVQAQGDGDPPVLRTPDDVARIMIPRLRDRTCEVFVVLVLDARNALRFVGELTVGTLNASLVHPREVFKLAIDHSAASIIIVHNHPSGSPEPSPEDIAVTHQIREAGEIVGIPLRDHLVVAGSSYTSHAERGLM